LPVLLTGSETSKLVPAWRSGEMEAVLSMLGADFEAVIYESRDHIVSQGEIARARSLLAAAKNRAVA
jgi:hypothetical protein